MIKKSCLITVVFVLTNIAYVNAQYVHVKNSAGTTITTFAGNNGTAIQNAINYASTNGYPKVYLEPGAYSLDTVNVIGGLGNLNAALYLPNNIELYGSSSSKPLLQISSAAPTRDAFLGVCASFTSRDVSLTSVNIHHLIFQAVTSGVVKSATGMWVGKADAAAVSIHDLEIYNTSLTAMIVGWVADYERDPADSTLAYVRQCNGQVGNFGQIYNNLIQYCGGDGICVIGNYYYVTWNTVQYCTTAGVSNGITLYSNSSSVVIQYNQTGYNNCGVGLDGSNPACLLDLPQGMSPDAFRDQMGRGNEKGFVRSVTIRDNGPTYGYVYGNTYGINLFRTSACWVYGNYVARSSATAGSRGVTIQDSRDTFVAGNLIYNNAEGIRLWSVGCSYYYTQWNGIGLVCDPPTWSTWNNSYSGNTTNIRSLAENGGTVANNTIRD